MRRWNDKRTLAITLTIIAGIHAISSADTTIFSSLPTEEMVANVRYIRLERPIKSFEIKKSAFVEPSNIEWIKSPIEGKIYQLLVAPGSKVKPGDILARVSNNLVSFEDQIIENKDDFKYEEISKSITSNKFNAAELIFQQARLDALEEQKNSIQDEKMKINLTTSSEGIVYKIVRPINTSVNQGENVIALAQKFNVIVDIDNQILKSIQNAKKVRYYLNTPTKKIPLFSENKKNYLNDNISRVQFSALSEHYIYLAEKSNWEISIILDQQAEDGNFQIPHESIHISIEKPSEWFVWLIEDDYQKITKRTVKIGEILLEQTTITSGLNGNEKLVISAPPWIKNGTQVHTIELDQGAIDR